MVGSGKSYIKLFPVAGGNTVALASTPNEPGAPLGWSADGEHIHVSEPYHTGAKIFRLSTDGESVSEWSPGNKNFVSGIKLNESGMPSP